MFRLLCCLIGYAFGCIQTAYIAGRLTARIDIRQHGSGNAGTSNVIRVLGRATGVVVFASDVLKTLAAYTAASFLFSGGGTFFPETPSVLPGLYAGLGTVLGHNFPFFLRFKGGKGIASTLGLLLAFDWRIGLIIYAAGFVTIAVTRYISLGSLLMTLLIPVLCYGFGYGPEVVLLGALLTAMAWLLHRTNIARLRAGTERKFTFTRKGANHGQ